MPTRVVILGGGFAGVYTARSVLKHGRKTGLRDLEVHIVNRENYMVFQPMLGEVLSGGVGLSDTVSPIRRLAKGAVLHTRDVETIDLEKREVVCSPGFRPRSLVLPFDHLVVTLGNVTDFRGMTGLADHAMPFKTLGDALAIRNHVLRILDEADTEMEDAAKRQLLTFVVAGGGFSGIEAIAELQDFVRRAIRSFPRIEIEHCRFVLIHSRDHILQEVDKSLALYAQKLLAKRGVELMLNKRLQSATPGNALLADGTSIPTKTLIATVPSHPNRVVEDLIKKFGFTTKDKDGKARPDSTLRVDGAMLVEGTKNVWSLGDCARIPIKSKTGEVMHAPPTAQHAVREAELCGKNIISTVQGKPTSLFTFTGLGSLAALGHRRGVAQVMGMKVSGFPAWVMWRTIYLGKLPGLDRKVRVGISWALDLIFPPDLVQLRLAAHGGIGKEHFEPGEIVFEQGDVGDRVYMIVKGKAEVLRTDDAGQVKQLAVLEAGAYFGEIALLHRAPRSATIRCTESMDVLSIEKADFALLHEYVKEFRGELQRTAKERQESLTVTELSKG